MFLDRLLSPSYRIRVFKFRNLGPEDVMESFQKRGGRISEVPEGMDLELAIESLLASHYGNYVYVLKFKDKKAFISTLQEEITGKRWPSPDRFIARDEDGLKRFLLRELSRKSLLFMEVPTMIIWGAVWWLIWKYFESYPLGSILLFFIGFLLNDFAKVFEYFVLGYCRE